jgi:hypothetical protein
MRVELVNSEGEAKEKNNCNDDDNHGDEYDDKDDDEANTDEVVSNLVPSRVSLARRTRESIYLTLRLHNLILTST